MFVFLSFESSTSYNPHEQLLLVPAGSHSCVPLVASGKAERSLMILSLNAKHFACIASEIIDIVEVRCKMDSEHSGNTMSPFLATPLLSGARLSFADTRPNLTYGRVSCSLGILIASYRLPSLRRYFADTTPKVRICPLIRTGSL